MDLSIPDALDVAVFSATRRGGQRADSDLGAEQMPPGYALILDGDLAYYWLRYDGQDGMRHRDPKVVYQWAKLNYENSISPTHGPINVPAENS